jgi:hypothetical protein
MADMQPPDKISGFEGAQAVWELSHLRRETRTALELALVALAPQTIIDRLARGAGLLEAVIELPANAPLVAALLPKLAHDARSALDQWNKWHAEKLANVGA